MKQQEFDRPKYQYWWEAQFERDFIVMKMNWLQKLLYRCLLQKAFVCDTAPYIPNDDEVLSTLSGAENLEMWQREKAIILSKWEPLEGPDGIKLLRHKRLEEDYLRINSEKEELSNKRREAGRQGAINRWNKNGKNGKPMASDSNAWQDMANINNNKTKTQSKQASVGRAAFEVEEV